jgi:hypothetical protein
LILLVYLSRFQSVPFETGASLMDAPGSPQNNIILTNIESDPSRAAHGTEGGGEFKEDQNADEDDDEDDDDEDEDEDGQDEALGYSPTSDLNPSGGIMYADVLEVCAWSLS